MKLFSRICTLLMCLVLLAGMALPAYAATGNVTYEGKADGFVFEPGSKHSATDLFPDFNNVMPGDELTQKITVENDASNKVKVKIYICALGVVDNENDVKDVAFLNQLKLTVQQAGKTSPMFEAQANETDGLTDWVLLGTLYSGGKVDLNVTLEVPIEMGNEFQNRDGHIQWQFMVKEFPIEDSDPTSAKTGDWMNLGLMIAIMVVCLVAVIILLILGKKRKDRDKK